ncbi:virulence factor BrkB family protein [Tatumella saanichensis]|uniref:virulence factor BrkB family protein n=1 Tax=Tatumella saanichensis TaxID=480813 RepID=UPI0004A33C5B|nr:virulence factor BrkB family protein [Tatumella saanichensis]
MRLRIKPALNWLVLFWRRIDEDNMTVHAGNLTFVSLLALVPLATVVFALFAAFPVFSDVSVQLRHFIFDNFVPAAGTVVEDYLERFVSNVSRMTAVGAIGLIITALLLIHSIDSALNTIWRSTKKRPLVFSFAVYWMVLTLGPLLAGASLVMSSYLLSVHWLNDTGLTHLLDPILRLLPLLLSVLAFWLLYSIVPTCAVPGWDAFCGALVAGVLFELGKKAFSLYVTAFPSYQMIYGVLAVIPILFLWMYWTWCIVLLGAEVTVSINHYRQLRKTAKQESVTE